MSSRRCFKARKTLKVVSYKGGKVNRRSTLTVPVKYDSGQNASTSSLSSISGGQYSCDSPPEVSFGADNDVGKTFHSKPKCGKLRLKKKINSYRNKKIRLGDAWLDVRNQLYLAALELQALPEEQYCIIPSCKEKACCRCLDCGPVHFMCDEHTSMIHAGGLTLHCPEIWKNNRYAPYKFGGMEVWNTEHNADHGYCRDIVVINKTGRQHLVKFKFCCHEPESVTLVRHGLWPASPKEPQAAFENGFMEILKYMFLECRASLKSICQAINWTMPTLSPVHIKDIYRLLVGETFGEYRKMEAYLFHWMLYLAVFGKSVQEQVLYRPPNHGETLFIEQSKVDSFLKNYQGKSSLKLQESCNNFQAGSSLRSKVKTKKLDETAIFGAGCRHEVPIKFFSLKRGEQIGNAVYLLKWLKQNFANLDIYLYYDIACTLESHLKVVCRIYNNYNLRTNLQ
ncbi:Hypothetical predicted protein [Paramuricea clavata]|uniref:CxC1-like cysteine cluster associated with KDZ transposases domain-containing protein n=1 Tax=Paramuricea clavata TaxID=317549 RepID=A0A6S7HKP0_PARCT|nr:Hypothetical predicted protein [Paramuricea clavata]